MKRPLPEQVSPPATRQVSGTVFDVFREILGDVSGGRVLDVATGEGGFVQVLKQGLKDYTEIIGIDTREEAIQAARDAYDEENIRFIQMDAEHLDFADESFDTVNISVSLHHLANLPTVLAEMKRVLKRGGHCIVSEMCRDGQTEPQLTVVYIHHWAAEVDTARGVTHNPTFTRQEIVEMVERLGLRNLTFYDYANLDADPRDETAVRGSQDAIERVRQRANGLPNCEAFKQRGEELRQRIHAVGVQRPSVLIIVGEK
jgi:ubiquinone/menaquinone biosynthesis C-methylase UbiE